jgi:hypothetical protein
MIFQTASAARESATTKIKRGMDEKPSARVVF